MLDVNSSSHIQPAFSCEWYYSGGCYLNKSLRDCHRLISITWLPTGFGE